MEVMEDTGESLRHDCGRAVWLLHVIISWLGFRKAAVKEFRLFLVWFGAEESL
jgi:hypothetical protein